MGNPTKLRLGVTDLFGGAAALEVRVDETLASKPVADNAGRGLLLCLTGNAARCETHQAPLTKTSVAKGWSWFPVGSGFLPPGQQNLSRSSRIDRANIEAMRLQHAGGPADNRAGLHLENGNDLSTA